MKEPEAHVNSPLQLLAERDEEFAEAMWRFRHPEEDGEKLTLEAIQAEVPLRWGITVGSLDTLHRFYGWLSLRRDFRRKRDRIAQIKEEMARDPEMSAEQVEEAGRMMFLTDSFADKDAKMFATMVKLGQSKRSLEQKDEEIEQKDKALAQKDEALAQAERKIVLLEEAARKNEAARKDLEQKKAAGGLSDDAMELIERQLGMLS